MTPDDHPDDALLLRAVGALHDEPEPVPGWEEASARVRRTLRQTVRRARRLTATTHDLATGFGADDRLEVSERVVLDVLRRAVSGTPGAAPVTIELVVDSDEDDHLSCTGARLELVVGYGTALAPLTAHLRGVVTAALDDLLGPADRVVDLEVVDVEIEDPTL